MKFLKLFQDWEDVAEYSAHYIIFSTGDPADLLYFIVSGEVELTLHGKTLGTEGPGGIIGEIAMIPSAAQSATASSLTGVKLAKIDRTQLKQLIDDNAEFSLHLMAVLANRLRAVDKFIAASIEQTG